MSLDESRGRLLELLSKESGYLDSLIYRRGKKITLSGEFIGLRKGRLDVIEYIYPLFDIREIYLWERIREYYYISHPYYPPPSFYPYPFRYRE